MIQNTNRQHNPKGVIPLTPHSGKSKTFSD